MLKKPFSLFLLLGIASALLFSLKLAPTPAQDDLLTEYVEGRIESAENGELFQTLEVNLDQGETLFVQNDLSGFADSKVYKAGEKVVLVHHATPENGDLYYVMDHVRRPALYFLFALFIVGVLLVTRGQGFFSILAMGFSFLVIFKLLLPLLLRGFNPVVTMLLGSILILPVLFYVSHGVNRKSSVAMVGTLLTLGLTGILASLFTHVAQLSGLASEEAAFLKVGGMDLDFSGLLLAGILVSLMGILDDITVSQAAVVEAIKHANPKLSPSEVYKRAMQVGRDHITSIVNTLILVYTGASLPLLLLFMDGSQSFTNVLNFEFVSEEVVRTLVGSLGLVVAVPLTTFLATLFLKGEEGGHGH